MSTNRTFVKTFTCKAADITEYPNHILQRVSDEPFELIIPDEHANGLKLIWLFILVGMAYIPKESYVQLAKMHEALRISDVKLNQDDGIQNEWKLMTATCLDAKQTAETFHALYQRTIQFFIKYHCKKEEDKQNFKTFSSLLSQLKFNRSLLKKVLVDEIGDDFSDRGNDHLAIVVKTYLKSAGVQFNEALASNHGIEWDLACERHLASRDEDTFTPMKLNILLHAQSMISLRCAVQQGLLTWDAVHHFQTNHVKPLRKLFGYTLHYDEHRQIIGISFRSHAGVGLSIYAPTARKLGLKGYREKTNEELKAITNAFNDPQKIAKLIDDINAAYRKHVQENTLSTLYNWDILEEGYRNNPIDFYTYPLEFICFNRRYSNLDRVTQLDERAVFWIHGHDSDDPFKDDVHIFVANDEFGKTPGARPIDPVTHQEEPYPEYRFIYSQATPIVNKVFRRVLTEEDAEEAKSVALPEKKQNEDHLGDPPSSLAPVPLGSFKPPSLIRTNDPTISLLGHKKAKSSRFFDCFEKKSKPASEPLSFNCFGKKKNADANPQPKKRWFC